MVFGGVSSPGATVIKYWDVQTEKVTKTFEGAGQGIAMTERWLVTRNFPDCKTVRVFDLEMGKQVAVLTDFPSRVEKAAISQDGKYLALLEDQGPLKIWELPGGKELLKWNYQSVSALLFFKNEPTLAILRGGGGLAIYDLKTGKGTGPGFFNARAVSDDGKLMAMKGEVVYGEKKGTIKRYPDAVHILSREKRQIIASFNTEPKWEVRQLQFTPDGRYLLAAGGAGIVRLWDVSKLER
jgi:WD40 repeat protein